MKIVVEMQTVARSRDPLAGRRRWRRRGGAAADRVHPGLALRNLVENALIATRPGAVVTVALTDEGIEVRDQGPTIDHVSICNPRAFHAPKLPGTFATLLNPAR